MEEFPLEISKKKMVRANNSAGISFSGLHELQAPTTPPPVDILHGAPQTTSADNHRP